MSRADTRQSVVVAVEKGIESACIQWDEMCGEWLWSAPEYLVTTCIAQSLQKRLHSKLVLLEWCSRSTIEDGLQKKVRGRPHGELKPGTRFDLVLYYGNGTPRAAIEVKHRVQGWQQYLEKDANRLIQSVRHRSSGASNPQGLLAIYLEVGDPITKYADAKARWASECDRIGEAARAHLARHSHGDGLHLTCHRGKPHASDGGAWGTLVLEYWHRKSHGKTE